MPLLTVGAWVGILLGGYIWPLVPGLVLQRYFDSLPGPGRLGTPWAWLAMYAGVGLGFLAIRVVAVPLEPVLGLDTAQLLRTNILAAVLRRPGAAALTHPPGETIGRMRADSEHFGMLPAWLVDPFAQAASLTFALAILARTNWLVTIEVVVPMVVALVAVNGARRWTISFRRSAMETTSAVSGFIAESYGAITAVKGAGAEGNLAEHFRELNDARRLAGVRDTLWTEGLTALSGGSVLLGTGAMLLLVGPQIRSGRFTVGDLALFTSYLALLSTVGSYFASLMMVTRQARVSLDRLGELVPREPRYGLVQPAALFLRGDRPRPTEIHRAPQDRLERLDLRKLTCLHPSGRGVESVSFSILRGDLVVVTGRVGSGKTTLLRGVLGLLQAGSGAVAWNGVDVPDLTAFMVPPRCSYVPQVPHLFGDTLRDNILLGVRATEEAVERAVKTAVLAAEVGHLDQHLETLVGRRGVRLSGGQVQRTAVARALIRDPELLVLDDVSSALDVETEAILWQRLMDEAERTCIAVSSRRPTLARASTVVVLKAGSVDFVGTLADALEHSEVMRSVWTDAPAAG
jgi:ATP-binding cassette subfamily B protein